MKRGFLVVFLMLCTARLQGMSVLVLAASSTTEAMTEIGHLFSQKTGHSVRFSFASSGALARQIQNGAPADIFLSANELWMDALVQEGAVVPSSCTDVLENRLVLIAPLGRSVELDETFSGWLAVGNLRTVPAGIYARQVLEKRGWLELFRSRLISGDCVRNVLFFVERGEVDAGIVYATDAALSAKVRVASVFSPKSHDPIRYPVGLCAASTQPDLAQDFLSFLQTDAARDVFESFGFMCLEKE